MADGSNILSAEEYEFSENLACYGAGGALHVAEDSRVSWTGRSFFSGNKARNKGGAVYVSSGSVISWSGPTGFFSNTVQTYLPFDGDSDSSWYSSSFLDSRCISPWSSTSSWSSYSDDYPYYFLDSTSSDSDYYSDSYYWYYSTYSYVSDYASEGGALCVKNHSHVSWDADTTFSENAADIGGAVLITSGSTLEWTGQTTFSLNTAAMDCGAVGSRAADETLPSSSSSGLNSRSIYSWSDIYSYSSWSPNDDESQLIIGGSTMFVGNRCGASGGALALLGMLALTTNTTNLSFSGNSAGASGGAVFISSTEAGPEFIGTLFVANSAPVGGAVFSSGSGNKETDESGKGGGPDIYEDPTTFRNCTFKYNKADATGGAVESAFGRDLFIKTTFKGNKASGGGALRLNGAAKIYWCTFEENKSDVGGGPAVAYFGTS